MNRSTSLAVLVAARLAAACSEPAHDAPDATAPLEPSAAASITAVTSATSAASAAALPSASATAPMTSASALDAGPAEASSAATPPPDCPDGMAKVGRACVDRWEAHLVTRGNDGAVALHPHVERPAPGVRYEARSAAGVFPQAYVSRVEAKAACEAAGKRLCSRREWMRACEGRRGLLYPYGQRAVAGKCNSGKPHLLSAKYGSDPGRWRYDEHFNDPALDAEPGFLAKSGEHEACAGDAGVYDLVGNLHEWVSDTLDADFVEALEAEPVERQKQPWKPGNGVFMGGFFSTTNQHGPGCTFTTIAHEPRYHDYSIGFRCCAAARAEPKAPAKGGRARGG